MRGSTNSRAIRTCRATSSNAVTQAPTELKLHRQSRELEVGFPDGTRFMLPCELLRVFSPSAEVRGHGAGERKLMTGKKYVNIEQIDLVGNYAIRIAFDDGHDTGIYAWDYLRELGEQRETLLAALPRRTERRQCEPVAAMSRSVTGSPTPKARNEARRRSCRLRLSEGVRRQRRLAASAAFSRRSRNATTS